MASRFTDYPGGVWLMVAFRTHRAMDAMQAGLVAAGPAMLLFAGDPEAQLFHGQALVETGVIATTDWGNA